MGTAFLFNLPYEGHLNPCLPIAEELVSRGDRVIVYAPEAFRQRFEATGAEFRDFPCEETARGQGVLTLAHWQLDVSRRSMQRLVRDAAEEGATYVLSDYACHWGHALAQHLHLPLIVLHSTYPAAFLKISPVRALLFELRARPSLLPLLFRFLWRDWWFAQKWRVPALGLPMCLMLRRQGLAHIALIDELLQPEVPAPGHPYHFAGTCVRRRGLTRGEKLPPLDQRPLIYVSLGTVWNNRLDFYRMCIDAFRHSAYQVLISVGSGVDDASLGPLPENVHVRRQVDQIEVLERAALFVSHAGMNSLCEAMSAGVPLLLFPQAADQFALSRLMARHGVAVVLGQSLSAQALRQAADHAIQQPQMRERARAIQSAMRSKGDSAKRAADFIWDVLNRRQSAAGRASAGLALEA